MAKLQGLPLELVLSIFDVLDLKSIMQCSYTCHSVFAATERYLQQHRNICLSNHPRRSLKQSDCLETNAFLGAIRQFKKLALNVLKITVYHSPPHVYFGHSSNTGFTELQHAISSNAFARSFAHAIGTHWLAVSRAGSTLLLTLLMCRQVCSIHIISSTTLGFHLDAGHLPPSCRVCPALSHLTIEWNRDLSKFRGGESRDLEDAMLLLSAPRLTSVYLRGLYQWGKRHPNASQNNQSPSDASTSSLAALTLDQVQPILRWLREKTRPTDSTPTHPLTSLSFLACSMPIRWISIFSSFTALQRLEYAISVLYPGGPAYGDGADLRPLQHALSKLSPTLEVLVLDMQLRPKDDELTDSFEPPPCAPHLLSQSLREMVRLRELSLPWHFMLGSDSELAGSTPKFENDKFSKTLPNNLEKLVLRHCDLEVGLELVNGALEGLLQAKANGPALGQLGEIVLQAWAETEALEREYGQWRWTAEKEESKVTVAFDQEFLSSKIFARTSYS